MVVFLILFAGFIVIFSFIGGIFLVIKGSKKKLIEQKAQDEKNALDMEYKKAMLDKLKV